MIVDADLERPPLEIATETNAVASVAIAVLVLLLVATGGPRLPDDGAPGSADGSARSACNDSGLTASMAARRYVELLGDRTAAATCWTPGRIPRELPAIAFRAPGEPSDVTVHSSTTWCCEEGAQVAAVQVSAIWDSDRAPAGWADRARRWIVLRQIGAEWTIDAIRDGP